VDLVFLALEDEEGTVAPSLKEYVPNIFAKGGDRTPETMPRAEIDVCKELGIEIVYGVGGAEVQSSSQLVRDLVLRPHCPLCGNFKVKPDELSTRSIFMRVINCSSCGTVTRSFKDLSRRI